MTAGTPLSTLLLTVGPPNIEQSIPTQFILGTASETQIGAGNQSLGAIFNQTVIAPDPNNYGWDLCLDAFGNIAVAAPPYALAQDAASEQKTFLSECWYDTTRGIPYMTKVIGQVPSAALLKSYLQNAALLVPGIVSATTYITGFDTSTRELTGITQISETNGNTQSVGF